MSCNSKRPAPPLMISQLGALSSRMHRECDKIFREQAFPLEMDQMEVALALYYSEEVSQQEMCVILKRDKASVNRTVSVLLKKNIVTVSQHPTDKRKTRVELTEAGKGLAIEANAVLEKFDAALSSELTEEEKTQFHSLMNKLISIVTPM